MQGTGDKNARGSGVQRLTTAVGQMIFHSSTGLQQDEPKPAATGAAQTNANVFADADALRQEAHKDLDKKDYDVSQYYKEDGIAQRIARNSIFGNFTLCIIFLNSLWIGLEMDANEEEQLSDAAWYFQVGEYFFFGFFSFEWLVRYGAFKRKFDGFRDKWFCFDSGLVFTMVGEMVLMPIIMTVVAASEGGDGSGNQDLGNLAMLRMFRLLRLTRMVRFMRSVPELVTLLKSMTIALRSVVSTLLLLLIFMYIFSIIFKSQLKTDDEYLEEKFGRIPAAMWTLLLTGTLMDNLTSIANQLLETSALLTALFIMFIFLSSFTVLNMLIGLLCEVVTAVAAAEKEKTVVTYVKSRLFDVLEQLDADGNRTISKAEFDELITIPEAVEALNELGVDVPNLVSLSDHLFEADEAERHGVEAAQKPDKKDAQASQRASHERSSRPVEVDADLERTSLASTESEEGCSLSFTDFLEMVIRLRADNRPSVLDIVDLRKLVLKSQRQVVKQVSVLEKMNTTLSEDMKAVTEQLDRFCRRHRQMLLSGVARRARGQPLKPLEVSALRPIEVHNRPPEQVASAVEDRRPLTLQSGHLPVPPVALEDLGVRSVDLKHLATGADETEFPAEAWDMAHEAESGSMSPAPGSTFTLTSGAGSGGTLAGGVAATSTAATSGATSGSKCSALDLAANTARSHGKGDLEPEMDEANQASPLAALLPTPPQPAPENRQLAADSGAVCNHPEWTGEAEVTIHDWALPEESPLQPLTSSSQEQPGTALAGASLPSEPGDRESTCRSSNIST